MKKVAIYAQSYSLNAEKEVKTLIKCLEKHNIVIFIEEEYYNLLTSHEVLSKKYPVFSHFNDLSDSFDMLFTVGGDGTILRAVTYIRNLNIPILGINTGRLGFLATIQKKEIKEAIASIMEGKFSLQERSLLQIQTNPGTETFSELNFALNEVTIARRNTTSMIGIKTYLDEEYLTNYWADGLIISTPTGSTGYSLSCGGPVILPDSTSLVITPIAPHNLNARPIIIPEKTNIQLEVSAREKDFLISLDSRIATVPQETIVQIQKAPFTVKTILLENQSYLKTLRQKLLWGEDTRNK
ncbi:NAD kinase [Tenacibaculum jejuense]|uniref:NAD kinase n=1 Tax=Tenacibaculum jejuense TaxID=584609 RepID=A0A238U5N2_9FLAO|nr:NAD kinase [Tenacibaculum jejuense]SNR14519.1 putative inorganic polyphosphate/ATP-NAD kinase [Tenacibaculum jejuense]